ncbi:MAG: signal peptidase I [Candidatus Woesearchaeota archaeon]
MIRKIIIIIIIFLFGMASSSIYANINSERPFGINITPNINSPADRISQDQIKVYNDRVVIYIDNPQWASFTPTGSMEPVLNEKTNAIEIKPKSIEDIKVGDIISYKSKYVDGILIHRVIYKGNDEEGAYVIVKGDNNPVSDPGRIRFNQIERVVVGLIY